MLNAESRSATWRGLAGDDNAAWDMVVIGGGITGAGVFREAARCGIRVLLVEAADFASGTSSRSSKLVHGGLRYLASGQWRVTLESVRERERLLREAPGLVTRLGFVTPVYEGEWPGLRAMRAALAVYDGMAGQWSTRRLSPEKAEAVAPRINARGLAGAVRYLDAQTDDARLVWRVIREALDDTTHAAALNYVRVMHCDGDNGGEIVGLRDELTGEEAEIRARAVVDCSGAASGRLQSEGEPMRLRPLRGSHLVFPFWKLPIAQAVTIFHPRDRRPMFALPWEGVTLFGTTDLDHGDNLSNAPRMDTAECDYLLAGIRHLFPGMHLSGKDAIASYSGVRPVVAGGAGDPSRESREHAIWRSGRLLMVAGGKLTTFRRIALEVIRELRDLIPELRSNDAKGPVLRPVPEGVTEGAPQVHAERLRGRHGVHARELVLQARDGEHEPAEGSVYLWSELRQAARAEAVCHLDDLLLRRVRIGLTLPGGGEALFDKAGTICREELGWDRTRWESELSRYRELWQAQHQVACEEVTK